MSDRVFMTGEFQPEKFLLDIDSGSVNNFPHNILATSNGGLPVYRKGCSK